MEQGAQSIYRAVAVLKAVAERNRAGSSLTELAAATGLTVPTVHRMLRAFSEAGLTFQQSNDRRYFLGPLIYDLGLTAAPRFDLQSLYKKTTEDLADQTGDTAFFSKISGDDMICESRMSGAFPVKALVTDVGLRRPIGVGAGGLAVLSAMSDEQAARIVKANAEKYPHHGKTVEQVLQQVQDARARGHVMRVIPDIGVTTLSMAIRDKSRQPFASISVSSISPRMSAQHIETVLDLMRPAIGKLESAIDFSYSMFAVSTAP
ncbi:MAG: IclR family transcriptional regulator [Pseudomonadota bacterium]